ncbi:DoxX family protein [Hydrogenovibrio marinus]|uniref:Membrane protein n=1 Tax=Hydrogenovibrio marinus TaxID=28885 RepID=A0A066ZVG3_HYDMR|nr:DoxX family protein [Hydrogenovibrio marinus]KDN96244.1 membrane protein [Hydrogenovibrio marinus]BBN60576.1 membrane protein [Hydrogenovibrio marinus]
MDSLIKLSAPLGRVMLAAIFIIAGLGKIANYTGTQGYMEAMGVPGALLPLVILTEVLGGLAIAFGWHTRIAAFLLAGFTLLAALIFHNNFADQIQQIMFLKNMAIIGGFLTLIHHGAGPCSLDNRKQAKDTL